MHGVVEVALGKVRIAQGNVACEKHAPVFDFGEEGVIDLGGAPLLLVGFGVFVEGPLKNGVAGENGFDFVPSVEVVRVGDIERSRCGRFVRCGGFDAGVVDDELFKVADCDDASLWEGGEIK